jgi:hypothetical protein
MIVSISSPTFDFEGVVELDILQEESELAQTTRRVTRIATLDGNAAVNDFGSTDADKTLVLVWRTADKALEGAVARLVRLYSDLVVSVPDAVYKCVPQSFRQNVNGTSQIILLVLSKLNN